MNRREVEGSAPDCGLHVDDRCRQIADASEDEDDEDAFDVKNLMNKFKSLQDAAPSKMEKNLDEVRTKKKHE